MIRPEPLLLGLSGCALFFACTERFPAAYQQAPLADAGPSSDASDASSCDAAECGFHAVDGLDDGGLARRVGDTFYTVPEALFVNAGDSRGWVLWRSYAAPDFSGQVTHLDRFDARGVFDGTSALASSQPDGVVLHGDGTLTAYRKRCGELQADTCFAHDGLSGAITEGVWPVSSREATRYQLDDDGNVVGTTESTFDQRNFVSAVAHGDGLYAVTWQGGFVVTRLAPAYHPLWSVGVIPSVVPPDVPVDAPIEELLRAGDLAHQLMTKPVAITGGVVVAATVARGTLAALAAAKGVELALPVDPRCADVVVAYISESGADTRYFSVPTTQCERLPVLSVAGKHAVVASVVRVEKEAEPNDTSQYDIGLGIVDLETGSVVSRTIALGGLGEDDVVRSVAPCGLGRLCLAGITGARSVDTGSTVTMGNGFVLPVSLQGEPSAPWLMRSPRHSEILHIAPHPDGGVLFFGTTNGPITHTADGDPWLGFNEGILGIVSAL